MITVFSKFRLRPGLDRKTATAEVLQTVAWYRRRRGCIRKYLVFNWDEGYGYGVYLWRSRADAEAFYAEAVPLITAEVGRAPEITYFDTPVVLDNAYGVVVVDGEVVERFDPSVSDPHGVATST
ncbi:MAG: monooxygenase [Kineosporiaceae bacterium]